MEGGCPEPGEAGAGSEGVTNPGFSNENSIIALNTLNTIKRIRKTGHEGRNNETKTNFVITSRYTVENVTKCKLILFRFLTKHNI